MPPSLAMLRSEASVQCAASACYVQVLVMSVLFACGAHWRDLRRPIYGRTLDRGPNALSFVNANGVRLYVEETGAGEPIVFVHELNSDYRGWEPQVRWFSRFYRCVTFNARGYPPSDVPGDPGAYGFPTVVHDIGAVVKSLGASKANIVGSSMGAYAALHFGWMYPEMVASLVVSGVGSGSPVFGSSRMGCGMRGLRADVPGTRIVRGSRNYRPGPHPSAASAQGPARLRRIPVPSARAFAAGQGANAFGISGAPSLAPELSEGTFGPSDSGAVDRRRRGCTLPGNQPLA